MSDTADFTETMMDDGLTDAPVSTPPFGTQAAAAPVSPPQSLSVVFSGSGSEYFRIWIVNLLLTLVTLGLYFPWAKVRRLRYFYNNTQVGDAPLDFHGNPKQMLKGYLLVAVMGAVYFAAGKISPMAGLVAFCCVAALWPALWKSSLQFRLANTSWRGMRFRFTGGLADAYLAILPLFVPAFIAVGAGLWIDPNNPDPAKTKEAFAVIGFAFFGLTLLMLALSPWMFFRLKRYQHQHYAFADCKVDFQATLWSFYKLSLKTCGMVLLIAFVMGILVSVVVSGTAVGLKDKGNFVAMAVTLVMVIGFYLPLFIFVKPYATTRLQNLVWSQTSGPELCFSSDLSLPSMVRVTAKNWLFTILTLGLYWPFAIVALTRLRAQAVAIETDVAVDDLVATQAPQTGDTAGDAAGDFFGIDIGL